MSVSIPDFWKVFAESRLLAPEQVRQFAAEFNKAKPAGEVTSKSVAQWLISRNVLSRYQATILLAGRSGPFVYGDYRVYDRVDKSRFAGHFRAVHVPTGHPVMLQFATGAVLTKPQLWAAASGSVIAASKIVSPHVQRYFEPVDLQKYKFIVSEDLRGNTVEELLLRGKCPVPEACRLMRLAALGLAQMHARQRVHGEMRPQNVLVEAISGGPANVKLLFDAQRPPAPIDWAAQQASDSQLQPTDFIAPELVVAGRAPDPLCDIYALGCVLYTLLAGKPPFAGGTAQQKMTRHASEPIPPLEAAGVPQPVAQVVAFLMAKKPTVRYQSALQAAEQLALFVEPAALHAAAPSPPPTLASYEQQLRSKHSVAVPVAVAAPAPAAAMPVIGGGTAAGISLQASEPSAFASPAAGGAAVMTEPALGIKLATKGRAARSAEDIMRHKKAQQRRNLIIMSALALLTMIGGGVGFGIWWNNQQPSGGIVAATSASATNATPADSGGSSAKSPDHNAATAPVVNVATSSSADQAAAAKSKGGATEAEPPVIPDDGKTLWASPTSGKPIDFRCVPPEGQIFLFLRPAALLATAEGQRVLQALGPKLGQQQQAFEAAAGMKLSEIEELHITLHNNDAKFPRVSYVVKTQEPITQERLLERWGQPTAVQEKSQTYYTGPTWAYYIPAAADVPNSFAFGEARDMKDVAAEGGAAPPMFPQIERLRRTTDSDRLFTMLFFPQFLFNDDGEPLFAGERAKVRPPLAWLLGDQLQAAAVSGHLAGELYFEMRMLGSLDKQPYDLAQEVRQRLDVIPTSLEDYFVALNPPPYWKKLAFRYPIMVRDFYGQTRVGVENEQAIINSVLPENAAHNLVLGGELLVSTAPGQAIATTVAASNAGAGLKTIADALQFKTSYSFDQQSLEFAMRDLAEDVKASLKGVSFEFAIKIIGDDLKLDGITRNQSIRDFKQENQTVADILTALVRKANPVTTVKDPSETDQKLVWLIGPDPDSPGKQVVLITTRTAAGTKKYTLPPVFVAKKK